MNERGILFSKPMVLALLAGVKTQTRRKLKVQPQGPDELPPLSACPYGQPGDRLWVREAWRAERAYDEWQPGNMPPDTPVRYEADCSFRGQSFPPGKLRTGLFMPRWASRLELEIVEIRLQHLHDITERDAAAEGVRVVRRAGSEDDYHADEEDEDLLGSIDLYRGVWESLHGPDSWEPDPWVWVMSFRVMHFPESPVEQEAWAAISRAGCSD